MLFIVSVYTIWIWFKMDPVVLNGHVFVVLPPLFHGHGILWHIGDL